MSLIGFLWGMWGNPVFAADRLEVTFSSLNFSIPIADLETYANTGKVSPELQSYARAVSPEDFIELRRILKHKIQLPPKAVSRMVYNTMGDILLQRIGVVLKTGTGQNGKNDLQVAFVKSAESPQGLTLISLLKNFPSPTIRFDLDTAVLMIKEAVKLYYNRQTLVNAVRQVSALESAIDGTNYQDLADLRQGGSYQWQQQSLDLKDGFRNRSVPTDIYWPHRTDAAPMVIISHGVGGTRLSFNYLAQHLASYGFVVVVIEHVGSNAQTIGDFFQGLTEPSASEAIDRPWDITFVLNTLEIYAKLSPQWRSRLNFDQIGIVGQSFGGYTALAVGGATLNFESLGQECKKPEPNNPSLNVSLILQCTINGLPPRTYILRDPRIKAVMAINPFESHVFDQQGMSRLEVPTFIVSSGDDFVTPAGPEQLYPFTWIGPVPRYLAVLEKGTHFSAIAVEETQAQVFTIPPNLVGPDPHIAQGYLKALSLAFFQTYLQQNPITPIYLQASYGKFLSNPAMPLYVVQSLSTSMLDQARRSR
jgi:predicted dienelactone hydrolase